LLIIKKIRIIRELAARSSDKKVKQLISAFNTYLQTLNDEKDFKEEKIKDDIEKGRKMIDQLSEMLVNNPDTGDQIKTKRQ